MLDREKIKNLYREAAKKKLSYPQLFESLKSIGVERYETNVLKHEIKYVGGGASVIEQAPPGFEPLTAASHFDLPALQSALGRVQKRETNYFQFLAEIAAAGVSFYRVDMKPRTVTYHGPTPKDKLVEPVPEVH